MTVAMNDRARFNRQNYARRNLDIVNEVVDLTGTPYGV